MSAETERAEEVRALAPTADHQPDVTPDEFQEGFGESLHHALDVDTWQTGEDLATIYRRIDEEVRGAVQQEEAVGRVIRERIFPEVAAYPGAPKGAGVYEASQDALKQVHRGLLFNGGVEAADGRVLLHDTLPLTIFQVGISLVSYQGNQGIWSHRLFRRDLRMSEDDPAQEAMRLLERREQRGGLNQSERHDSLSRLARAGVMAYAERAVLLRRSQAPWRMGHGNPVPFELITGSGSLDLMIESTRLLREMIEQHQRFVFVSSEPRDRLLISIGNALRPMEFAVVRTLRETIYGMVEQGKFGQTRYSSDTRWNGRTLTPMEWLLRFRDEVAPQVVVGVFRATRLAPPQVFYAHQDHADIAAHIAMADSVLQEHRGFPLLIDLADHVCRHVFGRETLEAPVESAYVEAGAPFRYQSERQTRLS